MCASPKESNHFLPMGCSRREGCDRRREIDDGFGHGQRFGRGQGEEQATCFDAVSYVPYDARAWIINGTYLECYGAERVSVALRCLLLRVSKTWARLLRRSWRSAARAL
jgi:hypothetical protein